MVPFSGGKYTTRTVAIMILHSLKELNEAPEEKALGGAVV